MDGETIKLKIEPVSAIEMEHFENSRVIEEVILFDGASTSHITADTSAQRGLQATNEAEIDYDMSTDDDKQTDYVSVL